MFLGPGKAAKTLSPKPKNSDRTSPPKPPDGCPRHLEDPRVGFLIRPHVAVWDPGLGFRI